jgi:hypothetical protein
VPSKYDQIFRVQDTDMRYIQVQQWQTYGAPAHRLGGEPVQLGTFIDSYSKQYVVANYALGDTIFKEDVDDDLYGIIHRVLPQRGGALAESFRTLKERLAANWFKLYGFTSATQVPGMIDGLSLANTAHPISKQNAAYTYSNRPSVDIDLSIAAYQAARANLVQQPAPNNYAYMDNAPDVCVINPNLHQVAYQIFNDPKERGTADNQSNTAARDGVSIIEWPYWQVSGSVGGTYTTPAYNGWMILGKKHHLEWYKRSDVVVDSDWILNVQSYLYVATERFAWGASDGRGIYASPGT